MHHTHFSLVLLILAFTACKSQSSSEGKASSETKRSVSLPKVYTSKTLDGSCAETEYECKEYRGLEKTALANRLKTCKKWQKAVPCSKMGLVGACFDSNDPYLAVHIYADHPNAQSMAQVKKYCKSATYFIAK